MTSAGPPAFPPRDIPTLPGADHSWAFHADPYRFISRACGSHGSDVVQARLLLRPTLCLMGAAAAELFDDATRFSRAGLAAGSVCTTLPDAVRGLDGGAQGHRRQFFMTWTVPEQARLLVDQAEKVWHEQAREWRSQPALVLYVAAQRWLMRSACDWAGIPLSQADLTLRTVQLVTLFDRTVSSPLALARARWGRWQLESWLGELIRASRRGGSTGSVMGLRPGSAAAAASRLSDAQGRPLAARLAATQLLNLLRPVVAVSVFVTLAAHALHLLGSPRGRGDRLDIAAFVEEVRRYYAFFPAVAAWVRQDFEWQGYFFPKGRRALLDLYGTNHDIRTWGDPAVFRPERFQTRTPSRYDFVPQGGGPTHDSHRCPGEGMTVGLMKLAVHLLALCSRYRVPEQDASIQMRRMPALPASGLVITDFEPVGLG